MFVNLERDVVLVEGALKAAIYDLRNRSIFSLCEDTASAAHKCFVESRSVDLANDDVLYLAEYLLARDLATIDHERIDRNAHLIPTDLPPLFGIAWIELSQQCNHTCTHCYNSSGPQPTQSSVPRTDLLREAIRELVDLDIEALKFLGGEPLAHPQVLKDLITFTRKKTDCPIYIHSNGTLITDTWAAFCAKNTVEVDVSVYGHCPELHDEVTGTNGSFRATLRGLDILDANTIRGSVKLTVLPSNEAALPEIEKYFIKRYPERPFSFDYLRPIGRGTSVYSQLSFTHLNRYNEHEAGFRGPNREEFLARHTYNSCLVDKIKIGPDGSVSNCIMSDTCVGSVSKQSLREIITSAHFRKLQQLPLSECDTCRDCEFRFACDDCRPISHGVRGSWTAKPPECRYDPYTGIVQPETTLFKHLTQLEVNIGKDR